MLPAQVHLAHHAHHVLQATVMPQLQLMEVPRRRAPHAGLAALDAAAAAAAAVNHASGSLDEQEQTGAAAHVNAVNAERVVVAVLCIEALHESQIVLGAAEAGRGTVGMGDSPVGAALAARVEQQAGLVRQTAAAACTGAVVTAAVAGGVDGGGRAQHAGTAGIVHWQRLGRVAWRRRAAVAILVV